MSEARGITLADTFPDQGETEPTPERSLENAMYMLVLFTIPGDDVPEEGVKLWRNLARKHAQEILPEHATWQDRVDLLDGYMANALESFVEDSGLDFAARAWLVLNMPWFDYEHELDEAA